MPDPPRASERRAPSSESRAPHRSDPAAGRRRLGRRAARERRIEDRTMRVSKPGQWARSVALNRLDGAATRMMRRGDLEIGWWLARSAWGRGYASEAAAAARAEAFGRLACTRLIARVRPENAASAKVAERLGMHLLGGDVGRSGEPILVYGLDRPR